MGVSLVFLRRARPGIDLRMFGWVCVYAPTWPGISFWRYPFLDLRPEKWVDGWVGRAVNFLRQFAPTEPGARSRELRRAYRELSCLTQLRLAELLRSAEDNSLPK